MRKPLITRLADCLRAALSHSTLRVVIDFGKGVVRIDAQSAIAIAAAVLIIGMVVPRELDGVPPTHAAPTHERAI